MLVHIMPRELHGNQASVIIPLSVSLSLFSIYIPLYSYISPSIYLAAS